MSQEDVLKILKELGGKATLFEIRKRAREKYPDRTLYLYVSNRLSKLEKWDVIENTKNGRNTIWQIKKKR